MQDRQADGFSPGAVHRASQEQCRTGSDRTCSHCANLAWPQRCEGKKLPAGRDVAFPICVDHPDRPGRPREVDPAGTCANFRPQPGVVLRDTPPEPQRPTDRYIPLTRGLWAVVDAADYERLSKHHWYASPSHRGNMYARRTTRKGTVSMHREIMNPPKGMQVDHKDRNGLNNRQENLRNCTAQQNQWNRGPRNSKSRFKGVYPSGGKWFAAIKHKGRMHYLGTFDDEADAARARDRKAYELQGQYAYLNFPNDILTNGKETSTT